MNRHQAFDRLISDTLATLDDEQVKSTLASSLLETTALEGVRHIVSNAFLPNMRHGVASTPTEYFDTNNIALVPTSKREARKGIIFDSSMYQLTPERVASIAQAVSKRRESGVDIDESVGIRALSEIRKDPENRRLSFSVDGRCHIGGRLINGLWVIARPIITINTDRVRHSDTKWRQVQTAALVGHEALHGYDYENLPSGSPHNLDALCTTTEARGYHLSAQIYGAAGAIIQKTISGHPTVYEVDAMREKHNKINNPFAAPQSLVEEFRACGVI